MDSRLNFHLITADGRARRGEWRLAHGTVQTPAFMPVGTQGVVRTLAPWEVKPLSENIILCNTYHMLARPGLELIRSFGGLHRWIRWQGNILTDSGGFQVMSLSPLRKLSEEGVQFKSFIDGSPMAFTPESVVDAQTVFGSDVMMVLDECTPYPAEKKQAQESMELSMRWAKRAHHYWRAQQSEEAATPTGHPRLLLGIMQGGMYADLRRESAARLIDLDMDGYAIGGLSVGEPTELLRELTDVTGELLPAGKIRYQMGVGKPEDLVEGVAAGIDVFDCVLATRNARNGGIFLEAGHANVKNRRFRTQSGPLEEGCGCRACVEFDASFIYHLYKSNEIMSLRLLTEHNLFYLHRLMQRIRTAIENKTFEQFRRQFWGLRK